MPLIHQSQIRKIQDEFQDYLAKNKNKIIDILEQIEQLESAYEQLTSLEAQHPVQQATTASSPKTPASDKPFVVLDNDQAVLHYFLNLLNNPKISPPKIQLVGYHNTINNAVRRKINDYPASFHVQQVMFFCLMANNNETDQYAIICDNWTEKFSHADDLLAYFCLYVKKHITKAKTHVDELRIEMAQLTEKRDEARQHLNRLLQQLKYLHLLNPTNKELTEKTIKQKLGNIHPSLRALDNFKPLTDAVDHRLTEYIAKVSNIEELEKITEGLTQATEIFQSDVEIQLRKYFTEQLYKFTRIERLCNSIYRRANKEIFATQIANNEATVATLKQALTNSPHQSKSEPAKPSFLTQSINLISAVYTTLQRETSELINGFTPDSISVDDIDFSPLNSPDFSAEQLTRFLEEKTAAIDTATKQLEDNYQYDIKKSEDEQSDSLNDEQNNTGNHFSNPDDFPIWGFLNPGISFPPLTVGLNRAESVQKEQRKYEALTHAEQLAAEHSLPEQVLADQRRPDTTKFTAGTTDRVMPQYNEFLTTATPLGKSNANTSKDHASRTVFAEQGNLAGVSSMDVSKLAELHLTKSDAQESVVTGLVSQAAQSKREIQSLASGSVSQAASMKQETKSLAPSGSVLQAIPSKLEIQSLARESGSQVVLTKQEIQSLARGAVSQVAPTIKERASLVPESVSLPTPTTQERPCLDPRSVAQTEQERASLTPRSKSQLTLTKPKIVQTSTPSEKKNSTSPAIIKTEGASAITQVHHVQEATNTSNSERTTPPQKNIDQPQAITISLVNKVLIPHVVAVRQYQSNLINISLKIATKLALFEAVSDINAETIETLITLKSKIDACVRDIDGRTITDYHDDHLYTSARNIIALDQAQSGTVLNIGKCLNQAKGTCVPPVTTIGWFDWIVDKIHAFSSSFVNFIYPDREPTPYLTENQQNDATEIAEKNPYSFIATIQEEFEIAGTDALNQIERYDNIMRSEQEQGVDYARASGVFYSPTAPISHRFSLGAPNNNPLSKSPLSEEKKPHISEPQNKSQLPTPLNYATVTAADNKSQSPTTQNNPQISVPQSKPQLPSSQNNSPIPFQQNNASISADVSPSINPNGFYAKSVQKKNPQAEQQTKKHHSSPTTKSGTIKNNNSFTVCF